MRHVADQRFGTPANVPPLLPLAAARKMALEGRAPCTSHMVLISEPPPLDIWLRTRRPLNDTAKSSYKTRDMWHNQVRCERSYSHKIDPTKKSDSSEPLAPPITTCSSTRFPTEDPATTPQHIHTHTHTQPPTLTLLAYFTPLPKFQQSLWSCVLEYSQHSIRQNPI